MSFSKKTWVDRVVERPIRRLLTIVRPDDGSGTFVADIERDEGTVTTEGDAFSAANMNDLETRIKNAFDDAGGGNFVGVRYHASLSTYPDYPCWEDMTAAERAKYDYSTGAIVTFIDEDMPDDIIGTTDISDIADGTLTGGVADLDDRVTTLNASLTKNDIGDRVDISSYNSTSNLFEVPADGYIEMENAGGSSQDGTLRIYSSNNNSVIIGGGVGRFALYVRKGMHVYGTGTSATKRYMPIV